VHSAYANAFEFGPHMSLQRGEFQPSKFFIQSDLRRRTVSRWALPQISSISIKTSRNTAQYSYIAGFILLRR